MSRSTAILFATALAIPLGAAPQERPEGTNRLYHETSPYLQLHASNPVDWYPWGDEAVALARQLDRPIFLSIGYSTCYWCHRMEEDVFENPEIARLMNDSFINIKVDREERPDLDEIYMTATQLITRRGGWPNSVFLTPDLEPFFAGTYFPPEDRGGLVGFPTVIGRVVELWTNERGSLEESAARVADAVARTLSARGAPSEDVPSDAGVQRAYASLRDAYDEEWGGFGSAPKFPSPANLFLLLSRAKDGDADARRMLTGTLHRMAEGAIYDHVAGGFHRYATDARWRIPHFEKMLYDNALLAELLIETAELTGDRELARYAHGTLDFVLEEMTNELGGFKSAIDAQTDGHEGAYYVWTREELDTILTESELELLGGFFDFAGEPNFEETRYTVYLTSPLPELAAARGLSTEALVERMASALHKLRARRSLRKRPLVDDKVLTDWNGMMIRAMAKGGAFFGEPRYRDAAVAAASFVVDRLTAPDHPLHHAWREGESKVPAFLDDYVFLIRGLTTLYRESFGDDHPQRWLDSAETLADELESRLRDPSGGYFLTTEDPLNLVQTKGAMDGAVPSGNAAVVDALLDLAELTGKAQYTTRAESAMKAFSSVYTQFPDATKTLAVAIARYHRERDPHALAKSVVTASLSVDGDRFEVALSIRPGWHINANPASSELLIPTAVAGSVEEVHYPKGESLTFSFADDAIDVYSGRVGLTGTLRTDDETSSLLTYQACDDARCLAPVELRLR